MQRFMDWLSTKVNPVLEKWVQNPWVKALQRTMMATIGIIIFSSIINIYQSVKPASLPDLGVLYNFSFFLLGLYESICIPYFVMEGLRLRKIQVTSMILSVCVFLMGQGWQVNPWGPTEISFSLLGPQGIVLAMVAGYWVSFVMYMFRDFSFFKEDSVIPQFVTRWFDEMIPMLICEIVPFVIVYVFGFSLTDFIVSVFSPIERISNTLPGFLLMNFCYVFFYSIGASGWIFSGAFYPILMNNIAADIAGHAAGTEFFGIATNEVIFNSGWIALGGLGATLPLLVLMLRSKSKRLSGVAKGSFIPGLCNINEPIVYGAPIVMNPILMIPMWINSIVLPLIVYTALKVGFIRVPFINFNLGFVPSVISSFFINDTVVQNLIMIVVAFVVAGLIYYPFFKVHEKNELAKEEATGKVE